MDNKVYKQKAVSLRKEGKTYKEILEVVPVAKSTLSLWLRSVELSKKQVQEITLKKRAAQIKGGQARRTARLMEVNKYLLAGEKDIPSLDKNELFIVGVALYWGEGTKKSGQRVGMMVDFANSDPAMVKIFVKWLMECCDVRIQDIEFRLHLHESHKSRENEIKKEWLSYIKQPGLEFGTTLYKKHNPKTVRFKVNQDYIGLVSVRVKKSTKLHRRIMGWIYAIIATQNR